MTDQPIYPQDPDVKAQLEELRASNDQLSADVRALTDTIRLVNELASEQAQMKLAAIEAEERIQAVDVATQERIDHTRRAGTVAAACAIVAIPLVSILVYLSLINHVNTLLDEQRHQAALILANQNRNSYSACTTRNQSTLDNADREETLSRIETKPQLIRIHADSAAKLRVSVIDCSHYLKPVPK